MRIIIINLLLLITNNFLGSLEMVDITSSLPVEMHGDDVKFLSDKTVMFTSSKVGKPNTLYKYDLETNTVIQAQEYRQEALWFRNYIFNDGIYVYNSVYVNFFLWRRIQHILLRIDPETMEAGQSIKAPDDLVLRELSTGFFASSYVLNDNKGDYIYYLAPLNKTIQVCKKYLESLPDTIEHPYVLHENKTFILRGSTPEKYWILQRQAESYDVMEYYPSEGNWGKRFEFPLRRKYWNVFSLADRIIATPTRLLLFDKEELCIYPLDGTGAEQRIPFVINENLRIADYDSQNDRALIISSGFDTGPLYLLIDKLSE
jgi:hypothetical protein